MCKPYNGKMKEFKWRPGIFQERLTELRMYAEICGYGHDDRFHRTLKCFLHIWNLSTYNHRVTGTTILSQMNLKLD